MNPKLYWSSTVSYGKDAIPYKTPFWVNNFGFEEKQFYFALGGRLVQLVILRSKYGKVVKDL